MVAQSDGQFEEELDSELEWASRRKKSCAFSVPLCELKQQANPFEAALTKPEKDILRDYENQSKSSDGSVPICCNLNQKPSANRGVSSAGSIMYTVCANPSLHFQTNSDHRRWLVPSELLLVQGVPVKLCQTNVLAPSGSQQRLACSFQVPNSCRNRQETLRQIGNSMQVMVVAAALFYTAVFTQWPQSGI
eukprot:1501864-Pyramimonas_sp.AAC.1